MVTTTRVVVYNGNSNDGPGMRAWLKGLRIDVALIGGETGTNLNGMYRDIGRLYIGEEDPPDPGVLIRRRGPMRKRTKQITKRVYGLPNKPNLWRDRHLVSVIDERRREFNIATHANAAIQKDGRWLDNDGAMEWRHRGLPRLAEEIERGMRWGRKVRVGADMNFPRHGFDTPADFFRRQGLSSVSVGVMWFAYDPNRETVLDLEWLPVPPGADAHRAIFVELENR